MPKTLEEMRYDDFVNRANDGIDTREIVKAVIGLDTDWVIEWVQETFEPGDVFSESLLDEWAKAHGYIKA